MEFSEYLKKRRSELNLRCMDVAERIGWTPMYYGRFENGKLLPTEHNCKYFAKALDVPEQTIKNFIMKKHK